MLFRIIFVALFLFFSSCSQQPPAVVFAPPNPEAPLAFFGEGNFDLNMKQEYALALHNAGLYSFVAEDISEERVENSVEIRLDYKEESKKLNHIPVLVLNAEFLKNGVTAFKFTVKEENPRMFFTPANMKREKKLSRQVLLEKFLMEVKRVKPEEKISGNG
ncbi:MAG: hypothetical protein LBQ87_04475 [Candidatus Fibromonas sp.]|nr:hypothetical protein [Candidatus Fibromonas sp.]